MEISEEKVLKYEKEHWKKSDEILEKIQSKNLIDAVRKQEDNLTKREAEAILESLAEAKACRNILEWRKEKAHRIYISNAKHRINFIRRRRELVLALEYGNTSEGLLISNILENNENPISTEVLSNYCDELAMIPKEDLEKILKGLVEENIIESTSHGWTLLNPVTFPNEEPLFRQYSNNFLEEHSDFASLYCPLIDDPIIHAILNIFTYDCGYIRTDEKFFDNVFSLYDYDSERVSEESIIRILCELEMVGLIIPYLDYNIANQNTYFNFDDKSNYDFIFEMAPAFGKDSNCIPEAFIELYKKYKNADTDEKNTIILSRYSFQTNSYDVRSCEDDKV